MTSQSLRFYLVGLFAFIILGTFGITQAAPPRRHRPRVRPRPARVRRVRPGVKRAKHRKRITGYRPVVISSYYRSGGVVVIKDSGSTTRRLSSSTATRLAGWARVYGADEKVAPAG